MVAATAKKEVECILAARDLHKHYRMGEEDLHVLAGVEIAVKPGEWVAVLGASGSGKSTLLHLLGGLDRPDQGQVWFDGQEVFRLRGGRLDRYRNQHVGFVFQFYHLLPELTALENVLIGAMVGTTMWGWPLISREKRQQATDLLEQLGLGERLRHRPNKLSGGERQRVAIARALVNNPDVLLADEPTGNLDQKTGQQILEVLQSLHRAGQSIVMVTHDTRIAAAADRQVTLEGGRLRA
ncbi:MAG: ABC transporter ATP-binding protein [Phycisphaeraceae bacterium]|nr:ABC transporter ATP-binding protein [Phycisphaeraceae bacterium]